MLRECGARLPRARPQGRTVLPAAEGGVKGLFSFGEDPVRTDPDTHHVDPRARGARVRGGGRPVHLTGGRRKYADVILPGRSYAEKEGTFTNTERRDAARCARPWTSRSDTRLDTDIFIEVMNRMGSLRSRT